MTEIFHHELWTTPGWGADGLAPATAATVKQYCVSCHGKAAMGGVNLERMMADANVGYLVFARKSPAGRIALGPPCMDVDSNAMYFAFFAEGK